MSQDRSKTLVEEFYGNIRNSLAPTVDKLLHTLQILTGLSIGLARLSDDDTLNGLFRQIGFQPVEQL